jgi:pimeloyl-ACP methyl ester carboxylesterase
MMTMVIWIAEAALAIIVLGIALVLFTAWTARRVERAVPPRGQFIDINGTRVHYVDEGSGPPLVFIHGLAGQLYNFTHSLLDRLKTDYRVVIIDRPGNGYSAPPHEAAAGIIEQAGLIAHFIAALGLKRPVVIGHSLGGGIALALAVRHPEMVGGLALLAPVTHEQYVVPSPFQGLKVRSQFLRSLIAWTLATPLSIIGRDVALATLFGPQSVPRDFPIRGGGLLMLRPQSFIGASRDLVAAIETQLGDLPDAYRALAVPVGIIYGDSDRILSPSAHGEAFVAKRPATDYEVIQGGGHMILIASADRVADFIRRIARRAVATAAPAAAQ